MNYIFYMISQEDPSTCWGDEVRSYGGTFFHEIMIGETFLSLVSHNLLGCGGGWIWNCNLPNH